MFLTDYLVDFICTLYKSSMIHFYWYLIGCRGQNVLTSKNRMKRSTPGQAARSQPDWEEGKWKDHKTPAEERNQKPDVVTSHEQPSTSNTASTDENIPLTSGVNQPTDVHVEPNEAEQLHSQHSPDDVAVNVKDDQKCDPESNVTILSNAANKGDDDDQSLERYKPDESDQGYIPDERPAESSTTDLQNESDCNVALLLPLISVAGNDNQCMDQSEPSEDDKLTAEMTPESGNVGHLNEPSEQDNLESEMLPESGNIGQLNEPSEQDNLEAKMSPESGNIDKLDEPNTLAAGISPESGNVVQLNEPNEQDNLEAEMSSESGNIDKLDEPDNLAAGISPESGNVVQLNEPSEQDHLESEMSPESGNIDKLDEPDNLAAGISPESGNVGQLNDPSEQDNFESEMSPESGNIDKLDEPDNLAAGISPESGNVGQLNEPSEQDNLESEMVPESGNIDKLDEQDNLETAMSPDSGNVGQLNQPSEQYKSDAEISLESKNIGQLNEPSEQDNLGAELSPESGHIGDLDEPSEQYKLEAEMSPESRSIDQQIKPESEIVLSSSPSTIVTGDIDQHPEQSVVKTEGEEDTGLSTSSLEVTVDAPSSVSTHQVTHVFQVTPPKDESSQSEQAEEKDESVTSLDSNSVTLTLKPQSSAGNEVFEQSKHMVSLNFSPQIMKPLAVETSPDTEDSRFTNTVGIQAYSRRILYHIYC